MHESAEHEPVIALQVMLDKEGRVIRPAKLWCDTESAQEAAELSEAFNIQIPAGFTGKRPSGVPAMPFHSDTSDKRCAAMVTAQVQSFYGCSAMNRRASQPWLPCYCQRPT